ncbi:SurA N-terminal domain-containing protein [Alkalihalobacterium alkalinitrilicum]|uniref:SurA N-terminal domain-containing protein n=1 Tax=Alkalihalobacterium alkalinitrilicum TaxID=427920 RepID=UPI001302F558|nr:SurA N-terminal domain-containing protein [Alkalihalobacterium alkalinitrilicum]
MYRIFYILIIGVFLIGLAGCADDNEDSMEKDEVEVIAIINEEKIYNRELDHLVEQTKRMYEEQGLDTDDVHLLQQIEEQIVEDLINQVLILQAAERDGMNDEHIEEQINEIKLQYEDEAEFLQELKANDMTVEDLKQMIKIDLYIESHLQNIEVTAEEVEDLVMEYNNFTEEDINVEEVKPLIESELTQRKRGEEFNKLINQLKEESDIQIFL